MHLLRSPSLGVPAASGLAAEEAEAPLQGAAAGTDLRDQPQPPAAGLCCSSPSRNQHFASLLVLTEQLDETLDISGVYGRVVENIICSQGGRYRSVLGMHFKPDVHPSRIGCIFPLAGAQLLADLP